MIFRILIAFFPYPVNPVDPVKVLRSDVTGKGRHPKFYDPETKRNYPIKSNGKKTLILSYALEDLIKKFDLPADVFD